MSRSIVRIGGKSKRRGRGIDAKDDHAARQLMIPDSVRPEPGPPHSDPTTQPGLADVWSLVNKFRSAPGAPIKAQALLAGDDAFGNISTTTLSLDFNFGHIAACVDAFRGKPYPFAVQVCP